MSVKKHLSYMLVLALVSMLVTPSIQSCSTASFALPVFNYADALVPPDYSRAAIKSLNDGESVIPGYYETSEYLLGSIAVGIILLESDGSIDPSTEDWTSLREPLVIMQICDNGLPWLADYNLDADLEFFYDIHYRVPTRYEPISRPSDDQGYWISEAMEYLGYSDPNHFTQVRNYINDLRSMFHTDWAFAIFIVDSLNDPDGRFADGLSAYAFLGGPFFVMTYDNGDYGIEFMDYVAAHEACHIFYATDEYDGVPETSGYLGVQDLDGSGCMMERSNVWYLCINSQEQLGWRDSDEDGIPDILDTYPDTTLSPYTPDPTNDTVLTCSGSAAVVPYPNSNPYGTGKSVTLNTLLSVEFRVEGSPWQSTTANDTMFDEPVESFTFTTQPLYTGTIKIETRARNSVNNLESAYASDTITITSATSPQVLTILESNDGSTWPPPGEYVYSEGTYAYIQAAPELGFGFDHWEINNSIEERSNPLWLLMNTDYSLHPVFTPGYHDIAPTNITLSKTVLGECFTLEVSVTIENQGDFPESVETTLYGNATPISTLSNVTVSSNSTVVILLHWDSTGFPYGLFRISVYTTPVMNENETGDNHYVNGYILVTIPGDVNGNRDVDIFDMVAMATIYGVVATEPTYDPNCDIDGDGDIDIFDIVAAATHYGESW